jgi:phosphatidylserine/phosphatidylglycerophosphate/cardiolipin synthase-like enzyme
MRRIGSIPLSFAGCLLAVFLSQSAPCIEADVRDISSERYYDALHQTLKRAESSINVAMFEIRIYKDKLSGPQYNLLQDLIEARKRGVKVKVWLDRSDDRDDETGAKVTHEMNSVAYDLLKKAGVDVRYVAPSRRLHAKLIVVDERIVVDGSTNWSFSALLKNAESATMIVSQQYALQKIQWMARLHEADQTHRASP